MSTMQNPKPAAGNHSTTNPAKSSPSPSPSPLHQPRRAPSPDVVKPNPVTHNTAAAGSEAVNLTSEGGSSAVVAIGTSSSVAKNGPIGRGGPLSVSDKDDPLKSKGSSGGRTKRKREWKYTNCPCPVCVSSRKQADCTHPDDVVAGLGIDLNMNPKEGKVERDKVKDPLAEKTPKEGAEKTSDAAGKKSEGEKYSGAAANENAKNGKGKTESSAETKRGVEEKAGKEKGEGSPSANKDGQKKAFAFDLNELPSHEWPDSMS